MSSTATKSRILYCAAKPKISSTTRAGGFLRNAIKEPFSPQNVQWDLAPHQHPLELSNRIATSGHSSARKGLRPRRSKNSS